MSTAREEILGRIRHALDGSGARTADTAAGPVGMTGAPTPGSTAHDAMVERFVEVTADYRAVVQRCGPEQLAAHVAAALQAYGAGRVVIPPGLEQDWLSASEAEFVIDDDVSTEGLDRCDAVVTAASVGIAETGTIVLDHTADQGRRALTLVPDVHVCVIRESQVTPDVPGAIRLLRPAIEAHRALTWISGPSATSDIELNRIEGVHGPRHLHVIVVAG
ncbi:LutC/YkgG family protein [Flexivirga endophytica]|nr:lactate utilization protein C [Flexivirga endophytica]